MSDCPMDLKLAILAFDCLTLLLSMMVGLSTFSVSVCWLSFVFVTVVSALAAVVVTFSSSVSSSVLVMEASVVVVVVSSNRSEICN